MVPAQGAAAPSCWGFGPTTWPRGGPPLSQAQVGLELAGPPPQAHSPPGARTKSSWSWEEATPPKLSGGCGAGRGG